MMKQNIRPFVAKENITVLDALKMLDKNRKGFLIVIDEEERVIGILTDGDIRRAFIKGIKINDPIDDVYTRDIKYLTLRDGMPGAIDLFKDEEKWFFPIVDEENKLLNIITKKEMHILFLQGMVKELDFDFLTLDEETIEHEIFHRPWGYYKTTVMNEYYQSKVISVNPKAKLSLQSHNRREEHWIIAHGKGIVQLDQSEIEVKCGNSIFIPKGCKHRITNLDENDPLIYVEVQIGDYFGEDDIIRYEDIYGRV